MALVKNLVYRNISKFIGTNKDDVSRIYPDSRFYGALLTITGQMDDYLSATYQSELQYAFEQNGVLRRVWLSLGLQTNDAEEYVPWAIFLANLDGMHIALAMTEAETMRGIPAAGYTTHRGLRYARHDVTDLFLPVEEGSSLKFAVEVAPPGSLPDYAWVAHCELGVYWIDKK